MLGTLPSKYLKWVTKNLRARDFEEWAQLADQVLSDPIYKDRIEWEFAQNLLNGDVSATQNPVSELLEISTRFGWDNDDKLGWSKIDFELLGTSKGGRIPRLSDSPIRVQEKKGTAEVDSPQEDGEKDNRERRRERIRLQRRKNESGSTSITQRSANSNHFNPSKSDPIRSFDTTNYNTSSGGTETPSRFPGRESLLKKASSLDTKKNTSNQ